MKPEFTSSGIDIQTYQEAFDEFVAGLEGIYGADIDLDPESPDGQRTGILSKLSIDLQSYLAFMATQLDPDLATGVALNSIIKLAGISVSPATRSQVDVNVTVDRSVTLPDGYTVQDALGQMWSLDGAESLTAGTTAVTFFADEFGAISAAAGTVTTPVTVILGVTGITNPADALPGSQEETEEEIRARRRASTESPSLSTVGKMFTELADLAGVTDVQVYENKTTAIVDTIPAHSIWVVIEGGALSDIAEVMVKNKHDGTGEKGSISQTYTESLTRPDGTSFVYTHTVKFDRPSDVPLYINVSASGRGGATPDAAAIKAAIAEKTYHINETAVASELYALGYQAGTNFILYDMEISDDGISFVDSSITNDKDEKFTVDAANITVTVI